MSGVGSPPSPPVPAETKPSRDYHHGDLRAAIMESAVALIAERGIAKLSLRECARRASVSHAAPYRHFTDKDALLWAIAEEGYAELHRVGEESMVGLETPLARLDAYGVAYVRFALRRPVHLRLMFTYQFDPLGRPDIGVNAFDLLRDAAVAVAGPDVDPQLAALAAWTVPHGLSMLVLDQRIPAELTQDEDAIEALARSIYAMWRGPLAGEGRQLRP